MYLLRATENDSIDNADLVAKFIIILYLIPVETCTLLMSLNVGIYDFYVLEISWHLNTRIKKHRNAYPIRIALHATSDLTPFLHQCPYLLPTFRHLMAVL